MMSSAIEQDARVPLAPRAGADLRAARERVGWSLPDIASGTAHPAALPRSAGRGTHRRVAGQRLCARLSAQLRRHLGLTPTRSPVASRPKRPQVTEKTELAFPVPVPERGVPAGAVVLLGVVLAVGAYAGWYRLSGEGRLPAETSTPDSGTPRAAGRAGGAAQQPDPSRSPRPPTPTAAGATSAARRRRFQRSPRVRRRLPRSRRCRCPSCVRSIAHRAARDRRCLGAGARPRRAGAAEPHPACRRDLGGAGEAEPVADHRQRRRHRPRGGRRDQPARWAATARFGATCRWIPT